VFGESSGATDVGVLMASPLAKGLFHRAVAESGTIVGAPRTRREAEQDGQKLADALKAPGGNSLMYLRSVPTAQILNASVPLISVTDGRTSLRHFVIDGYAVPRSPAEIFRAGQQHPVPLLIGTNARERSPGLMQLPDDLSATLRRAYGPLGARAMGLYRSSDALYGTPAEQWGERHILALRRSVTGLLACESRPSDVSL
jgi:para-nitrobenzyl esterase